MDPMGHKTMTSSLKAHFISIYKLMTNKPSIETMHDKPLPQVSALNFADCSKPKIQVKLTVELASLEAVAAETPALPAFPTNPYCNLTPNSLVNYNFFLIG